MKVQGFLLLFLMSIVMFFIVPVVAEADDIVNPGVTYTYERMVQDIRALERDYPDLIEVKVIGYSEYQRPIYAVGLGTGKSTTFINGSHHAREWISTTLTMYMIDQYAQMHEKNMRYGEFDVRKVLDETTIWFVPMLNPDGVILQQRGLSSFPSALHPELRKMNDFSTNFERWKSNAKGVDLNRQYDAGWDTIRNNRLLPSWTHHKGYSPMSSAETKAIVNFTRFIDPEMAVSYHSSGEVLYWKYKQTGSRLSRDQAYAQQISNYTGYTMIDPGPDPSGGGYTDWFIDTFKRPAFTPELGSYAGDTHVPLSEFPKIWSQNRYIGLYTASEGYKLYLGRGGEPKPPRIDVEVDGSLISSQGVLINQVAHVPFRETMERMGLLVEQVDNSSRWRLRQREILVELTEGRRTYQVNGESRQFPEAFQRVDNQLMVPARAVVEAFGHHLSYNSSAKRLDIETTQFDPDTIPPDAPWVDDVTDLSTLITGTSEVNAMIQISRDDVTIGQARAGAFGHFEIAIPVLLSPQQLTIHATDLAGNRSDSIVKEVVYTPYFRDSMNHWATEDIGFLKDRGITKGYTDGRFGVEDPIKRSEAAALIVRSLEEELVNEPPALFPDVTTSHPFFQYISTVQTLEIMIGDHNGYFHPDKSLTRAEMAKILTEAFNLEDFAEEETERFPDIREGHWAMDYIHTLQNAGITRGYPDGTFRPENSITRAEFAALLARVMLLAESQPQNTEPDEEIEDPVEEAQEEQLDDQQPVDSEDGSESEEETVMKDEENATNENIEEETE